MKNTEKFTKKAENYAKYRPSYPKALMEYLKGHAGMSRGSAVADIGAGTGILTALLAQEAGKVYAVEPNDKMRQAGVDYCRGIGNVTFVNGTAENTTLDDACLDCVTAAQSFHWFNKERAAAEFRRILKPDGKVVLIWNRKVQDNDVVAENIEISRRYCPDFKGFSGGMNYENSTSFNIFRNGEYEHSIFRNDIDVTLEEFIGGNLSTSYAPNAEDAAYGGYIESLRRLFEKHSDRGHLSIPNNTHSYAGYI